MPIRKFPSMKAGGEKRLLNVRKDPPDIRDRMYEPALIQLQPSLDNRGWRIRRKNPLSPDSPHWISTT
jgi:hypothetical protein